jgi:hypothetical protein
MQPLTPSAAKMIMLNRGDTYFLARRRDITNVIETKQWDLLNKKMQIPPKLLLGSLFTFEGEAARADDLEVTRNPYRQGTQEHASWLKGWLTPPAVEESGEVQ